MRHHLRPDSREHRLRSALWLLVCLLGCAPATGTGYNAAPNILFIVADDLGNNDLASFRLAGRAPAARGSTDMQPSITPTIDALARDGLRYSRFYSDASCAATRAGLLTGRYPAALGFRPAAAGIDPGVLTLPERLRDAGYRTHLVGKWHLGFDDREAWPLQQGFDSFFGFLNQFFLQRPPHNPAPGRPGYMDPYLQTDNGERRRYRGHLSWLLLDAARARIHAGAGQAQPWFLAFWPYAPHEPLQPPPELAQGFEATPRGRHGALLATLDRQLAGLLAALDESGQRDETLIVFVSDNGGTARHAPSNLPLEGSKGFFYEGGVRVPLLIHGGGMSPGAWDHRPASYLDLMPTLLRAAGAQRPEGLPGVDLLASRRRARPLFWSSGVGADQAWSVLSPDGRWRLTRDALHPEPGLFAVRARERSQRIEDDDLAAMLSEAHDAWAATTRRVTLEVEPLGPRVRRVTGPRFQKAPGAGAHSLALCARFPTSDQSGRIAFQEGLWSLDAVGDVLRWEINSLVLSAPLPAGQRGRLLLASNFNPSLAFPGRAAVMQMFWNDRLIAAAAFDDFPLRRDISAALVIGSDDLPVKLGSVALWNYIPPTDVIASGDAPPWGRWSGDFECAPGHA